jgi:hypothetical protein
MFQERKEKKPNVRDLTEKLLLQDYAPACVLVNEKGEILYVYRHTGKYLELPSGEITNNILRSARQGAAPGAGGQVDGARRDLPQPAGFAQRHRRLPALPGQSGGSRDPAAWPPCCEAYPAPA